MMLSRDYWSALFRAIANGMVIPVIGANAIRYSDSENLNQYILRKICKARGVKCYRSYDMFMYETGVKETELHNLYHDLINKLTDEEIEQIVENSGELLELLKIKSLTILLLLTPEVKIIERLLRIVWKYRIPEGYKSSLNFMDIIYGSYNKDILKKDDLDIPKGWSGKYPFTVYLLGKSNESGFTRSFALTEDDTMFYVRKLIEPKLMPSRLCNKIKNKFFLFVGCDFTDWMFRFLYSAWRDIYGGKPGERRDDDFIDSTLTLENYNLRNNLAFDHFIKSVNLKIGENYKKFLPKLTKGFNDFIKGKVEQYNLPPHIDVFISYAHEDFVEVKALYQILKARGIQAWLDKIGDDNNVISNPIRISGLSSGENFLEVIHRAIKESTIFVPVISRHIIEATNDRFVFKEWDFAIEQYAQKTRKNPLVNFIIGGFLYEDIEHFMNEPFGDKDDVRVRMMSFLSKAHTSVPKGERRKEIEILFNGLDYIVDDVKRKLADIVINIEDIILKHG